jgi:hypothetical protein
VSDKYWPTVVVTATTRDGSKKVVIDVHAPVGASATSVPVLVASAVDSAPLAGGRALEARVATELLRSMRQQCDDVEKLLREMGLL